MGLLLLVRLLDVGSDGAVEGRLGTTLRELEDVKLKLATADIRNQRLMEVFQKNVRWVMCAFGSWFDPFSP